LISSIVTARFGNGRKLGYPTANIESELEIGVYTAVTVINKIQYGCIVTVSNPPTTEIHIIGYSRFDLVGFKLEIKYVKRVPVLLTDKNCLINRDATHERDVVALKALANERGKKRIKQILEKRMVFILAGAEKATKRMSNIIKYGLKKTLQMEKKDGKRKKKEVKVYRENSMAL